jgi:hypothetical protein
VQAWAFELGVGLDVADVALQALDLVLVVVAQLAVFFVVEFVLAQGLYEGLVLEDEYYGVVGRHDVVFVLPGF